VAPSIEWVSVYTSPVQIILRLNIHSLMRYNWHRASPVYSLVLREKDRESLGPWWGCINSLARDCGDSIMVLGLGLRLVGLRSGFG